MKRIVTLLFVFFFAICMSSCAENTALGRTSNPVLPEDMLQAGTINVDEMSMGLPTAEDNLRFTELVQKLQVGISANQEWLSAYIIEYEGQTLPYHPNLGLSEDEYDEYLQLSDRIRLYKSADGVISIEKIGEKQYKISNVEESKLIDNIIIDLSNNTVSTNYGVCKYSGEVKASDDQIATGRWSGYSWMLEDILDAGNFKSIQFNLGQLEDSKKIIMYYQVKLANGEEILDDFEVIQYSL